MTTSVAIIVIAGLLGVAAAVTVLNYEPNQSAVAAERVIPRSTPFDAAIAERRAEAADKHHAREACHD